MLKLSKHTTPVLRLVCSTADICSTVRQCPVSHEASVSVLLSSGSVQCLMSPLDPRPGSNDKYLTSSLPQASQIPTKNLIVTTY